MKKVLAFLFFASVSFGVYAQEQTKEYAVKISILASDKSPSYGSIGAREGAYYFAAAKEGDVLVIDGQDKAAMQLPTDAYQSIKDYLDREVGAEKYGVRSITYQPTEVRNVYRVEYVVLATLEERTVSVATLK